jgi:PP-loop superfamily ATP-utilizing enzyme
LIEKLQNKYGKEEYSCLIGYSGGKDSTALLDTLVNTYNLKPLIVTINTGFMTKIAKQNIEQTLVKMNLLDNHLFLDNAIPLFAEMYRHHFLNHHSNEKSLTLNICHVCTDLIHTILVKKAMEQKLDYVFIGYSPDQIARFFYTIPPQDNLRYGQPRPQGFKRNLSPKLRSYYLSSEIPLSDIPTIIFPYHVIDYDEDEIIERIETKGLIDRGKGDPILTNCHVVKAALWYDFQRYGGITYALQYAELVRQKSSEAERQKARKKWLRLILMIGQLILRDKFNTDGINRFFKECDLSKQEIKRLIKEKRKADPNREDIRKNINLIRKNRLI